MRTWKSRLVSAVFFLSAFSVTAVSAVEVFKLGHCHPTSSPYHIGLTKFADLVAERTNGEVKVTVYANSQLGDEPELAQGMRMGTIDMGLVAAGHIAKYNKDFFIFDLPFLFRDYAHVDRCLDGEVGKRIIDATEEVGITVTSFWESGFRNYLNNKHPVDHPADMAGLQIRVPDWPALIAATQELGANPVPMLFSELYMACQQGVVDGQEGPTFAIVNAKFYEVQKYMVMDGHTYTTMILGVSPRKFKKLSEANQAIFLQAAREAGAYQRSLIRGQVDKDLDFLESQGMIINRNPDKQEWIDATRSVYEKYRDEINQDLVELIQGT